jgi:molybdopterin-guanine dinucleotide biosynthesis protein
MERLAKVQRELKLIEGFEREQAQAIAKIRDDEERREEEVRFIQNAI